jgi:hypothetical protein
VQKLIDCFPGALDVKAELLDDSRDPSCCVGVRYTSPPSLAPGMLPLHVLANGHGGRRQQARALTRRLTRSPRRVAVVCFCRPERPAEWLSGKPVADLHICAWLCER